MKPPMKPLKRNKRLSYLALAGSSLLLGVFLIRSPLGQNIFKSGITVVEHDENYKAKTQQETNKPANMQVQKPRSTYVPTGDPSRAVKLGATGEKRHVSKNFISENCAKITLAVDMPITGATFLTFKDAPGAALLAISHGEAGSSLYNMAGEKLWHKTQRADIVAAFKDKLLIYRKTEQSAILERFDIDQTGQATLTKTENPSEIAATTLQRSAYAALGPVSLKDDGVLLEQAFIKFKARPTAIAATSAAFDPRFPDGAIAIGLDNGEMQIWDKASITGGCS